MAERATALFPRGTQIGSYIIGDLLIAPSPNSYVFNATSTTAPGKFVFKYIRPGVLKEHVQGELYANETLSACPNAVVGFDFVEVAGSVGYFMDEFTRQDLLFFIQANQLDENAVRSLSFRIIQALAYMHRIHFVHRDLKPDNIFLHGDGLVPLSFLADFGLAKQHAEGELLYDGVGSKPYCAPEVFSGAGHNEAVDMWAFGVLLFVMITRSMPFRSADREWELFLWEINQGAYYDDTLDQVGASDELCELIANLIKPCPAERWTAEQVMAHPFYASEMREAMDGVKQGVAGITGALDVDFP
jgi:serine/threonine protein kinase